MMHRIFTAINLPEDIKNQLVEYQKKIEGLFQPPSPIRWTKKDNLHITSEFLGNLSDNEVMEVCRKTEELGKTIKPFTITLDKIIYGPPKKMPPRMIWATGEKIAELGLTPHLTLGRIKMWEFRQIEPDERPDVSQNINLNFEVASIDIMESQLKNRGVSYILLKSNPLEIIK